MTETQELNIPNLSAPKQGEVPPVQYTNPKELGISETETMGFTASPKVIGDIIKMISLPLEKISVFPKIVLNFDRDNGRIWWGNKKEGSYMIAAGYFSNSYVDNCWGNGSIALSAKKLLDDLEYLRGYKEATFWANPKSKIFGIQAGRVDKFTNFLDNIEEIKNHIPTTKDKPFPMKFDEEHIVVVLTEENKLVYGADIDTTELDAILKRGDKYKTAIYPFSISNTNISVSFNDLFNPKDTGANTKELIAKPGSLKLPSDDKKIDVLVGDLLHGPAKNLSGIVKLRFGKTPKAPMYLCKYDKNESGGVLISAYYFGTKG